MIDPILEQEIIKTVSNATKQLGASDYVIEKKVINQEKGRATIAFRFELNNGFIEGAYLPQEHKLTIISGKISNINLSHNKFQ